MGKSVTMDDIARAAGVSRGAVSLALRGSPKISAKRTKQIFDVAKELGYRVNMNASRLAQATPNTYGVMVSDLHNPITADILDGLVHGEGQEEFDMHLCAGFNSAERERVAVNSLLAHRVRGIVLIGSLLDQNEIQDLAQTVPTVVVGRQIPALDCVYVKSEFGGRLAAKHLTELGHKRLAHISGGTGAGAARRAAAFEQTARIAAGVVVQSVDGDYTQEGGYLGAQKLLGSDAPPTAIFAANDLTALGVLGAAHHNGLSIGADISVVGFDDIALTSSEFISLTTITYPRDKMGIDARALLQRRCEDPEIQEGIVELTPSLVIRESTGAYGRVSK